ncbi:MAG: zf-HC2 domain-containing protein, partial [Pseudoflavonifractor sp.]
MKACADYFDLMSARLDDVLSAEDAAALDAHLALCPECRRLAADLADLHAAFPGLNAAPPAQMLPNVMARIRAEDSKVLPFAPPAKAKIRWRALSGVAAMLTLGLFGAAICRFGAPIAPVGTPAPLLAVNDVQKTAPP